MLYKEDKEDEGFKWSEWRYWCQCHCPDHVLGFDEQITHPELDLEIYICSNPEMSRWDKLKNAFKLLFGKEIIYLSIVISPDDREELAAAIRGKTDEES